MSKQYGKNMPARRNPVKKMVAIGIGAAIFFVLGRFVAIPSPFPNTTINIQYAVLALFAVLYGPGAGFFIGFIGHTLIDLTAYGSPWWSWILASAAAGLLIGLLAGRLSIESGHFGGRKILAFNLAQLAANAAAWILLAPCLDILVYAEPAAKVFVQGAFAGVMNFLTTGIAGTLLLAAYARTRTEKGSLHEE